MKNQMLSEDLQNIIYKVQNAAMVFLKLIKANDVGATGAHQAGFHLPKNSWNLFFDSPGIKGYNKDKYITIRWHDRIETESRAIYYGKGTRNEYRLTRFGLNFPYLKEHNIDSLLIIIRNDNNTYEGFIIDKKDIPVFLRETGLTKTQYNSLVVNKTPENVEIPVDDDIHILPEEPQEQNIVTIVEKDLFLSSSSDDKDEIKRKVFQPKAHILSLLGDELIKSPVMAIYELIKNSYDADAMNVSVLFDDITDSDFATIVVEDDGTGMTSAVIENVWLEPGSDYRKPIDPVTGLRQIIKSPLYGRIPMGEKGIGRFAVHKLGTKIQLITRPLLITKNNYGEIISKVLADYEVELSIDWNQFNPSLHLSDIPISWKLKNDVSTFRFKAQSGTYIQIKGLKENWTKGMARDLKNQTISMLSPKIEENSFNIQLKFNTEWLKGSSSIVNFLDEAPYKVTAFIDENFNLTFDYEFSLKNNQDIGSRVIKGDKNYNKNIKGFLKPYLRVYYEELGFDNIEVGDLLREFDENIICSPFGSLSFEFYSYDLDGPSLRDYASDSRFTRNILREQAGIKVFKGDLRVFDYGEKGNDWLGIDLLRVNNKEWFSNNQNIGYVYLDPEKSVSLVEKTNREGFLNNKAYELFSIMLRYLLTEIKNTRLIDRKKWLNYNRGVSEKTFEAKFQSFRELIESSDASQDKKQKLIEKAEKLEEKYEEDTKVLMIPAGVGMTASVALHEIEKLVPRMEVTVKSISLDKDVIQRQVDELKLYTEGIISVLRKGGKGSTDVNEAIIRAVNNYKFRLKDRNIKLVYNLEQDAGVLNLEKRFFITVLMNLLDNSIYWLETVYREERSIWIGSFRNGEVTTVIIADNGPGFKDEVSDVVSPFFSRKANGIGIGLYLVDTIMMKYGKFDIIDPSAAADYGIPEMYDGAIVKLVFNKM